MLDEITKTIFGVSRSSSIRKDTCVTCGNDASLFNDDISRKEFTISGMCQDCQDSVFGG
jgi:hypothetical protein